MTSRKRQSDSMMNITPTTAQSSTPSSSFMDFGGTKSIENDTMKDCKPAAMGRTTGPKTRLRVRMKRFHGVAKWTWNAGSEDEVCGICQSAFEGVAPGVKYPGDECPVVFGKCGHAFHLQCVSTWLNSSRNTCPICRREWEFGQSSDQAQRRGGGGGSGGGNGGTRGNDNNNNDNATTSTRGSNSTGGTNNASA